MLGVPDLIVPVSPVNIAIEYCIVIVMFNMLDPADLYPQKSAEQPISTKLKIFQL